jgi:formylglycine-generating enzyme required for sulfatase activity
MVVLPGGGLALGRYEVTVGEYRAFASAMGGGAAGRCEWRDPGFPQTDRHPVTCVSWNDAQAYASWLSRTTGMRYRLPTEVEWARAAAGSEPGCYMERTGNPGTCPVGSYGSNAAGLSDMVGNLYEWTDDCWEGNCGSRVLRGASWGLNAEAQRPGTYWNNRAGSRYTYLGFRVARVLP